MAGRRFGMLAVGLGIGIGTGIAVEAAIGLPSKTVAHTAPAAPAEPSAIDCKGGKISSSSIDFISIEGLPLEVAIDEGESLIFFRGKEVLGIKGSTQMEVDGLMVVSYQDSTNRTVASMDLAPIGDGWRIETGSRCYVE